MLGLAVGRPLELERRVFDGDSKVLGDARLKLREQLGRVPVVKTLVVDDDVRR